MAHYQNGGQYYGQGNNPQQSYPNQYSGYTPQMHGQEHQLRRTSSFDAGDDAAFFDESTGQRYPSSMPTGNHGGGYQPYARGGYAASQPQRQTSVAAQYAPPPPRTTSYGAPLAGYQHQYPQSPPPPTASQPQYNPLQYGRAQSQYNPQAYTSVNQSSYGSNNNYGSGHQAYNPAAYQSPGIQSASTFASQPFSPSSTYSPPAGYPAPSQPAPPAPPRPNDQPYPVRRSTTDYVLDPYYTQDSGVPQPPGSAPLPQRQSGFSPPGGPPSVGPPSTSAFQSPPTRPSAPYFTHHSGSGRTSEFEALASTPEDVPADHPPPPSYSVFDESQSNSFASRMGRFGSPSPSPHFSQTTPSAPQHSPRRVDTVGRHPQARSLPVPPQESESDSDYFDGRNGQQGAQGRPAGEMGIDELMREVETEIMAGRSSSGTQRRSPGRGLPQMPTDRPGGPAALFSPGEPGVSSNGRNSSTNGHITSTGTGQYVNYGAYEDDSDAEAAAGIAAMRAAEEQEAMEDARRRSNTASSLFSSNLGSQRSQRPQSERQVAGASSDSDYAGAGVDVGLYSGGYGGSMHYGDTPSPSLMMHGVNQSQTPEHVLGVSRQSSSSVNRSANHSQSDLYDYTIPDQDAIHPFPTFGLGARVDTGDTGGLSEPTPDGRKLSFDDGDEDTLADSDIGQTSGSQSPSKDEFPDMYFGPGPSQSRPLPPPPVLMPAGTYRNQQYDPYAARQGYPSAPDTYSQSLLSPVGPAVPRSTSLSSAHSGTPQTVLPNRSKTDAETRKLLLKQQQQMGPRPDFESPVPASATTLDLPTIPTARRKRFIPAKLSSSDFKRCSEPWALSSIVAWVKDLSEDETDLREQSIVDGIVALFTNKVPTMNTADAETLGARVVDEMLASGTLVKEEEWVKFSQKTMSGVLWQLTGTGCYSQRLHVYETRGRCYSYHCMRTLKKVDLSQHVLEPKKRTEDWATFYKVKKEDVDSRPKKEVERQNILHEIVTTEDSYMEYLDVLRYIYRDSLRDYKPPIIKEDRIKRFSALVFGKVDAVKKVNEDYLLAQLKYRQHEQGPWIVGFSDIFREWIRKAKQVYIEYAAAFPNANWLVRREAERNILFKQFLDQARDNPKSRRLSWDTFLKAPITRLQRYTLLLNTVHKNMKQESEEKTNLQTAINEIKAVTLECDAKVAEMAKKVDLDELASKLALRKEMRDVDLRLNDLGREVIYRGDLQRTGNNRFTWLDTHAILFDHFLVLAKTTSMRDAVGGLKYERYDVSKVPIPMDLLVLESIVEEAIQKSSVKGIGTVATVTSKAPTVGDIRMSRTTSTTSGPGPGTLSHTKTDSSITSINSSSSGKTIVTSTVLDGTTTKDERVMYPFRVKHLGKSEVYTLYAPTIQSRQDWCEKIIEAKTKHAASLFAQNAEPFRLRVLADAAFAYDSLSAGPKSLMIRGTPLDRAIKEVEKRYERSGRPGPVCRAAVNCATVFNQPYGKLWCAIGTDYGVYISEYDNPRGWTRAIQISRVTQIAVLEEFSLFVLIADKALIAYHLDVVCPVSGIAVPNDSSRRAPQKLSGARDVGFFAVGRMKERSLVFYKKKEGISSIFKVLEPVLQKSTATRSRFLPTSSRRGQTEFFREYDEFYIPTDCYSMNLFHSSLAISTARGVEILTLDKKQTWSVPILKSDLPDVQNRLSSIQSMIKDTKPLGMFRLSDSEFLVAFEECAVYINKNGDVSRSVVMYFSGRAKTACLAGKYLVLFNDDFVEVRNAMDGRLRQVIAGKDVRCLDDGGGGSGGANQNAGLGGGMNGLGLAGIGAGPRTVKLAMQHPEYERCQIVLELVENEGQKE